MISNKFYLKDFSLFLCSKRKLFYELSQGINLIKIFTGIKFIENSYSNAFPFFPRLFLITSVEISLKYFTIDIFINDFFYANIRID